MTEKTYGRCSNENAYIHIGAVQVNLAPSFFFFYKAIIYKTAYEAIVNRIFLLSRYSSNITINTVLLDRIRTESF